MTTNRIHEPIRLFGTGTPYASLFEQPGEVDRLARKLSDAFFHGKATHTDRCATTIMVTGRRQLG